MSFRPCTLWLFAAKRQLQLETGRLPSMLVQQSKRPTIIYINFARFMGTSQVHLFVEAITSFFHWALVMGASKAWRS